MTNSALEPNGNLSRREKALLLFFVLATIAVRVVGVFRHSVNSDEPQHLHVAWAWGNGYVQYRDVFDNHAPLFHLLSAPLVALLGDQPYLLIYTRLAMLPLYAICLWYVYRIGETAFSKRVAVWSAVVAALFPPFFLCSLDYRADVLWAACWLMTIAVVVKPPLTTRRVFLAGLLLGATAAVSLKTTFLAIALVTAIVITALFALYDDKMNKANLRRFLSVGIAAVAGILLIPAIIVVFFWSLGALPAMYYCVVQHNLVEGVYTKPWRPAVAIVVSLLIIVPVLRAIRRSKESSGRRIRQVFLVALGGALPAALSFWPIIPRQDFLPLAPVLALLAVAGLDRIITALSRNRALPLVFQTVVLVVAVGELSASVNSIARTGDVSTKLQTWRDVLRLTDPGQTVMDGKGGLIFRPRPYYYVLEAVTCLRLKRGLIKDTIADSLVRSRTCVVSVSEARMPSRSLGFIKRNYLPVGSLLVAGKLLKSSKKGEIPFEVKIPAKYDIVTPSALGRGELDGTRFSGPRELLPGVHHYVPAKNERRLALVWAQAIARNFSPFHKEQNK